MWNDEEGRQYIHAKKRMSPGRELFGGPTPNPLADFLADRLAFFQLPFPPGGQARVGTLEAWNAIVWGANGANPR